MVLYSNEDGHLPLADPDAEADRLEHAHALRGLENLPLAV